MLLPRTSLSPADLSALADLERRVLAVDGGRLKLEWGTLRRRRGDEVSDLLWEQDGVVVGFAGRYAFGGPVEVTGMVDPAVRRRGVGTALLAEARRRWGALLLVVPRPSVAGAALARTAGATLHHSEHALVLSEPPPSGRSDPAVTLRPAQREDAEVLGRLLEGAFGQPVDGGFADRLEGPERTLVVERSGVAVGTVRLSRDDPTTEGVYGFAVDPAWQGRGIGRDVLRRLCVAALEDGAERVALEVESENDAALGLYTSLGFERVLTEDYWAVPA